MVPASVQLRQSVKASVALPKQTIKKPPAKESDIFMRLGPVIELLRTAIWTGRLSDEKPVSVMLVAKQESAKTEALKYFFGTSTLEYISDLTSRGLSPYKEGIERGKLRHLVLLDLVRIVAHGRSISERTLQSLASLMEEGETAISDGGGRSTWAKFPRIGVLMAITPDFFNQRRGHWRKTGFLTRFIPVSFKYTESTVSEIHNAIACGYVLPAPKPEPIPELAFQIAISKGHSAQISTRAAALGHAMQTYGFRYNKAMRALAKASARMRGQGQVGDEDIDKVLSWSRFFTMKEIEL